jgi:hypothetical protein
MLELIHDLPAESQEPNQYLDDFQDNFWTTDISWKLERQESFREPGVQSWVAMARGDWALALRLIEEMREPRIELQRKLDEKGITQRRVRIITKPVTPYLQWELHGLRLWAELGEEIRILPVEAIHNLESTRKLPEVVVLGGDSAAHSLMYEIVYREDVLAGSRKFTDQELIAACRAEIIDLWCQGEELADYFDREILPLPPPSAQGV